MPETTLLAFDFGLKRIGIAVGDTILRQARALTTVSEVSNDARFNQIGAIVSEWQPTRLLVGRPLNDDGTPHEMTARCERFAQQLAGRFRLPVEQIDERYSSVEADAQLRRSEGDWRKRKAQVDAEAARIILQDWLNNYAADERKTRVAA